MNPILKMTASELASEITSQIPIVNRQVQRVVKAYGGSPAVGELKDFFTDKLKFPTQKQISKMSIGELRMNYSALNKFLNAKTSTVSGTDEWLHKSFEGVYKKDLTKAGKEIASRTVTARVNKFLKDTDMEDFWDLLSRIREDDEISLLSSGYGSDDDGDGFRTIVKEYQKDSENWNDNPSDFIQHLKDVVAERASVDYESKFMW